MSRISPIPAADALQISSSKQITSLQGVVLALLENSLDAGASKVDVTIDFRRGGCTVEDDGVGIPPAEFGADGGLGRLYHTSKRVAGSDFHGSTGTHLASLAALSLLTITSRHREHQDHSTLVMFRGNTVARHVPAPPSHELSLAHGTRVTARDLFGNMPVRVKQRVSAAENGAEDDRAWQQLKHGTAALLLAWPKTCAVKLRDEFLDSRAVGLSGGHAVESTALTEKTLNQLAGKSTEYDFRDALPVLFQAGLAPQDSRHKWVPVFAASGDVSVRGAICLDPAPTKQCQFASIGIRPCDSDSGHHEIYDNINRVFASSSFGTVEEAIPLEEAEKLRRKHDRRYKNDGYTQQQLQSKKGIDRWPMFVLQLQLRGDDTCQSTRVDSTSGALLKTMMSLLEAVVTEWLAAHHFRLKAHRHKGSDEQRAPSAPSSPSTPLRFPADQFQRPNAGSMPTTPSLKRPTTAVGASTSRKRQMLDRPGIHAMQAPEAEGRSPTTYFNSVSRIKSVRSTYHDAPSRAQKPATAPAGQYGTVTAASKLTRHPFKLAPFRMGELSAESPQSAQSRAGSTAQSTICDEVSTCPAPGALPSNDFGSVDDEAFVEAAKQAERDKPTSLPTSASTSTADTLADTAALESDTVISWTNPATKQTHRVDSRTGVVLPMEVLRSAHDPEHTSNTVPSRQRAAIDTSISSTGQALSLARRKTTLNVSEGHTWLQGFLKHWDNPVFKQQAGNRIPVTSFTGPGVDVAEVCGHRCTDHALTQHFDEIGGRGTSTLSKAGLRRATVVRQVDEKFILCSTSATGEADAPLTLVLLDQHAASERVILEGLLRELCALIDEGLPIASFTTDIGCRSGVLTVLLLRPQRYSVSEGESELFLKHAQHFADWGILYDLNHIAGTLGASQVRETSAEHLLVVRALPPGIAERCTLLPNLLIELLRTEIWTVAQPSTSARSKIDPGVKDDRAWLRRMGSCPKGILEMLNSRACRSAIMFNDVLSMTQCEELLADVSRTVDLHALMTTRLANAD
ncbi:DNA mismatch repair protein [Teratosphaeriaceae sp. CCFEE 6253]|nr:DNA mismatch repair protein [Teratosphaeriaceae sp. CCFEE 6253]